MIEYFQNTFSVKITRIISKFIFDKNGELTYLGTNRLYINKDPLLCNIETNSLESWDFLEIVKKKKANFKQLIIEPPSETIKIFSDNLLSILTLEECKGDFCKYEFLQTSKGVLQHKKNEYQGQNELNCNHKLLGSIYSVNFEIKLKFYFLKG